MAIIKERPTPKLRPVRVYSKLFLGCDPEFFVKDDKGGVVGSEMIIPKEGLKNYAVNGGDNKIIRDGVQMEINPRPSMCRAHLANDIKSCFAQIDTILKNKKLTLDNGMLVKMKPEELTALSKEAQVFGCAPSSNKHTNSISKIDVDPKDYMFRSAGGHIHLGHPYNDYSEADKKAIDFNNDAVVRAFNEDYLKIVDLLDIVVGNTCVLLDRDPGNAERRKVYGRAGEYRRPSHGGLEYRTPSNFWLKHIYVYSFVFELARHCVYMVADPLLSPKRLTEYGWKADGLDFHQVLTSVIDLKDIEQAINTNDYDLAYKNFKILEPYFIQLIPNCFPPHCMPQIHHFFSKPLDYWFKTDMITHWTKEMTEGHRFTFYDMFMRQLSADMEADRKKSTSLNT